MKYRSIVFIVAIVTLVATTTSIINTQIVLGVPASTCTSCAKDFTPGQEKNTAELNIDSGAKAFAPG
jgi:hypothetical protein